MYTIKLFYIVQISNSLFLNSVLFVSKPELSKNHFFINHYFLNLPCDRGWGGGKVSTPPHERVKLACVLENSCECCTADNWSGISGIVSHCCNPGFVVITLLRVFIISQQKGEENKHPGTILVSRH